MAAAYAELIADQAEDPERDRPVRLRASALAIGPLLHLGVSGELFVALGQAMRRRSVTTPRASPPCATAPSATSPRQTAFEVGAYEPNASVLQPGEGERLVDAIVDLASAAPPA